MKIIIKVKNNCSLYRGIINKIYSMIITQSSTWEDHKHAQNKIKYTKVNHPSLRRVTTQWENGSINIIWWSINQIPCALSTVWCQVYGIERLLSYSQHIVLRHLQHSRRVPFLLQDGCSPFIRIYPRYENSREWNTGCPGIL